jgi:hypothetical protein
MNFEHRAVAPLRVFLALLFGILVVFQTLSLPDQFAYCDDVPVAVAVQA